MGKGVGFKEALCAGGEREEGNARKRSVRGETAGDLAGEAGGLKTCIFGCVSTFHECTLILRISERAARKKCSLSNEDSER